MNDLELEETNKENYAYKKRDRVSGSGPLRIGEDMEIRPDLYSMLFVSCLHAEYVRHFEEQAETSDDKTEKMLESHRK